VSSHLKKVYHSGGGEEAEDHGESGLRGVGVGKEIVPVRDDSYGKDDDDVSRGGDKSDATRDRGVIARAVTPPLHARVQGYDDDDNPWA